jgi:biotin operon repressor
VKWLTALSGGAKFTRIPHGAEHMDNLTALRVYLVICREMNNKSGECWRSQNWIAKHLNIGERAVGKACRWLKDKGYIARIPATARSGWSMIPQDVPDEAAERRNTGARLMDEGGKFIKPGSGEPAHVSPLSGADEPGSPEPREPGSPEPTIETRDQTINQTQEGAREDEGSSSSSESDDLLSPPPGQDWEAKCRAERARNAERLAYLQRLVKSGKATAAQREEITQLATWG